MFLDLPRIFLLLHIAYSVLSSCIQGQPCHDLLQGRDSASPSPGADDPSLESRTLLEAASSAISRPRTKSTILRRAPQGPNRYAQPAPYAYAQPAPYTYAQLPPQPQYAPPPQRAPQAPPTPKIIKGKKLGEGGQGAVYECEYNGRKAALKEARNGADMLREVQMHAKVNPGNVNHNIVGMSVGSNQYAVLELCEGDLFDEIQKGYYRGKPKYVKEDFLQILEGIKCMHDKGIYHRDLKPENILHRKGTMKISDFGSATENKYSVNPVSSEGYAPPGKHMVFLTYLSDPAVCASLTTVLGVEFWTGNGRSEQYDIWALGIILLEMVFMDPPWKKAPDQNCQIVRKTRGDALHTIYPSISEELVDICYRIFIKRDSSTSAIASLSNAT